MLESLRLAVDPITQDYYDVALIRQHCHIDEIPGTYDEQLILRYMRAAIIWAEGEMHRTIFSRGHQWVLRAFPCYDEYGEIRLPRGKTQSVESIVYSSNNQSVTLTGPSASPAGTGFAQDLRGDDGGVLMPPYSGAWPSADLNVPAPVVINFTAGWTISTVPEDITHALMFYVSDAYEMRGTADLDKSSYYDIRRHKLSPYMLHRW